MMGNGLKHTNSNQFHCHYNNTGYCKFGYNCKFQHYFEICQKKICRDRMCNFRHPKTCRFGINCKFFKRKVCVYKHIEKKNDTSEDKSKEIEDLENEVKSLKSDIEILKGCIESKEMQLNKKYAEKEESERYLLAEIKDKSEELVKLRKENSELKINSKDMKDEVKKQSEKINLQEALIMKFESMLKCDKCEFQAESFTEFNFQLSVKHLVRETKGNLRCTKCDFRGKKPLDLDLHQSIKHP